MGLFAMMRLANHSIACSLRDRVGARASKGTLVIRSPQRCHGNRQWIAAGKTPLKAMKLRPGKYRVRFHAWAFDLPKNRPGR